MKQNATVGGDTCGDVGRVAMIFDDILYIYNIYICHDAMCGGVLC